MHLGFDLLGIMNTTDCHWLRHWNPSKVRERSSLLEDGKKDTEIVQDEEVKTLVIYFI